MAGKQCVRMRGIGNSMRISDRACDVVALPARQPHPAENRFPVILRVLVDETVSTEFARIDTDLLGSQTFYTYSQI